MPALTKRRGTLSMATQCCSRKFLLWAHRLVLRHRFQNRFLVRFPQRIASDSASNLWGDMVSSGTWEVRYSNSCFRRIHQTRNASRKSPIKVGQLVECTRGEHQRRIFKRQVRPFTWYERSSHLKGCLIRHLSWAQVWKNHALSSRKRLFLAATASISVRISCQSLMYLSFNQC